MNAVKKELAIPIPTLIGQKTWREERVANIYAAIKALVAAINAERDKQNEDVRKSVNKTYTYYMQNLNKQIEGWNAIWQEPEMTDAWRRVEARKEKESASIYYGIMASAVKHNIGLDSKASIESAAKRFLSGMSWNGFTDFKQECITSWTKLFATNEVQFTDNAIDNFLAFVDHMSCSADTYVSLGGSNGCADQLTNWDGTQKVGLGSVPQKKEKGLGR